MSAPYDESEQHSTTVGQISEARKNAIEAIEKARIASRQPTRHPNLTPADETTPLSVANQRLVTYLLQLQPYSERSDLWNTDLGVINFEEEIIETTSGQWGQSVHGYDTDNRTTYHLSDLTVVISAINNPLTYAKSKGSDDFERYRVVLTSSDLITIFELADEIAKKMDFLADVTTPDFGADGGGAV